MDTDTNNHGYTANTKKFRRKIGYLIARKISLSKFLINAKIKNGMELKDAVDAIGSEFWYDK